MQAGEWAAKKRRKTSGAVARAHSFTKHPRRSGIVCDNNFRGSPEKSKGHSGDNGIREKVSLESARRRSGSSGGGGVGAIGTAGARPRKSKSSGGDEAALTAAILSPKQTEITAAPARKKGQILLAKSISDNPEENTGGEAGRRKRERKARPARELRPEKSGFTAS